jgi:Fic family protein
MSAAGYRVEEVDPFRERTPVALTTSAKSPYAARLRLMWHAMRGDVAASFPLPPSQPPDGEAYLLEVDRAYATDAYHSLSIEGHRVNLELIERVRRGEWDPDGTDSDRSQRDAMAARGYYEAFQLVRQSVAEVLSGANSGEIADRDHSGWYRALLSPSVAAGLVRAADLAGYRNDQVYLRGSIHVPPPWGAVRDMMPTLFDLLRHEEDASVRAVLGHFALGLIHPYMDGNGRMARFLANVMLASGGYPWTVVPVERRADYMAALETASTQQDIVPFGFIGELVAQAMR